MTNNDIYCNIKLYYLKKVIKQVKINSEKSEGKKCKEYKTEKREINKKLKDKGVKYYGPRRHILVIFIIMAVLSIVCVIGFPFVINAIVKEVIMPIASNWMLPDNFTGFLGGFVGVVIGFLLDLTFIERIRNLNRYRALLNSLTDELRDILSAIYGRKDYVKLFCEDEKEIVNYWNKDEKFKIEYASMGIVKKYKEECNNYEIVKKYAQVDIKKDTGNEEYNKLNRWVLNDIVSSAENDALFYNLPTYFAIQDYLGKPNNEISACIHRINGLIINFNNFKYENDERENCIIRLIAEIILFFHLAKKNEILRIQMEN